MLPGHTTSYGERKSRFMKWLCKIFKGTSRGGSNGLHPRALGENIFWHEPVRTKVIYSNDHIHYFRFSMLDCPQVFHIVISHEQALAGFEASRIFIN